VVRVAAFRSLSFSQGIAKRVVRAMPFNGLLSLKTFQAGEYCGQAKIFTVLSTQGDSASLRPIGKVRSCSTILMSEYGRTY